MIVSLSDYRRELQIQRVTEWMEAAKDRRERRYWAKKQRDLIAGRSPEQIERMEQEQGLK